MSAYKILWDKLKSHIGELPYCNRKCGKIRRLTRLLYYLPMKMGDLMNASLKALLNEQYKLVAELREENRKLKEYNGELIENHKKDIAILCEENKKLKETIKDHQLYEEKLEHRIIEFEELLHGE